MNIRRFFANFIFIIISFILQTTVFRVLDFGGIAPNLMMIVVASLGFIKGDTTGLITGFFSGLLVDIFFGTYLGFFALIYMYLGFIVGKFHEVFGFVCYVLMFLFRTRFNIGYYMVNVIIPEMVYTALVAIFYYPVILSVNNRIDEREQRSAKKFV